MTPRILKIYRLQPVEKSADFPILLALHHTVGIIPRHVGGLYHYNKRESIYINCTTKREENRSVI